MGDFHMDFFGGFANNSLMFEKSYLINVFLRIVNQLLLVVVLMLTGHKLFFYCVIMLLCVLVFTTIMSFIFYHNYVNRWRYPRFYHFLMS